MTDAGHHHKVIDIASVKQACSGCSLQQLCLPLGISGDDLQRLDALIKRHRPLTRGHHVFHLGDEFRALYAIRCGSVKTYTITEDGSEQITGFHLPGEIIGLDAIHSCKHVANVIALDTSAVCGLTFDSVSGMARHMPELQAELFRVMSQRISELETIAGDLSADERIAMFLLSLSDRFSRRGYSEKEFILAMSRRDIASYLRLATETVSRVLARFQKAGVVKVDRKQVRILDMDELKTVARKNQH
jgi:CRP/FNR family transcriptional regulator